MRNSYSKLWINFFFTKIRDFSLISISKLRAQWFGEKCGTESRAMALNNAIFLVKVKVVFSKDPRRLTFDADVFERSGAQGGSSLRRPSWTNGKKNLGNEIRVPWCKNFRCFLLSHGSTWCREKPPKKSIDSIDFWQFPKNKWSKKKGI